MEPPPAAPKAERPKAVKPKVVKPKAATGLSDFDKKAKMAQMKAFTSTSDMLTPAIVDILTLAEALITTLAVDDSYPAWAVFVVLLLVPLVQNLVYVVLDIIGTHPSVQFVFDLTVHGFEIWLFSLFTGYSSGPMQAFISLGVLQCLLVTAGFCTAEAPDSSVHTDQPAVKPLSPKGSLMLSFFLTFLGGLMTFPPLACNEDAQGDDAVYAANTFADVGFTVWLWALGGS